MGGPVANNNNAFSLGTAATEINVMHGETAAAATYARRLLIKDKDEGRPLQPTIEKMNQMVKHYDDTSNPMYCAKRALSMRSSVMMNCADTWSALPTAFIRIHASARSII